VARGVVVLAVVATALTLVGCYGSTEPATDVTAGAATLHGKGTANNGPASSYFEYWPTDAPGNKLTTPERSWPAGASGPLSEHVTGLSSGIAYSFRVCGHDNPGSPVCAQTRGIGDSVAVRITYNSNQYAQVDARSGGSGQDPNGTVGSVVSGIPRTYSVTCVAVSGNRALVGGVRTPDDNLLLGFQDGSLTYGSTFSTTPADCGTNYDSLPKSTANSGTVVVHDEP
jgi:hypothetical protein